MNKTNALLIALSFVMSASAVAVERATITSPDLLKPGQCAYAGEVYEPGEPIVGRVPGVAQVCTNVDGRGVALTVTKESMDMLYKSKVSFRTEVVKGVSIRLAETEVSEHGKRITCRQFIRNVEVDDKGQSTLIAVDQACETKFLLKASSASSDE
jgi:hypothetical protein